MIKQWIRKRKIILEGITNTVFLNKGTNYNDKKWWDTSFYTNGISDSKTISPRKSVISTKYHYASMEQQILRHFINFKIEVNDFRVCDIGSGAGHWIDFYKSLGASTITGIDVSTSSVEHLKNKYTNDSDINIYHGKSAEMLSSLDENKFDLINAIGVMFHIVNDNEWNDTISAVSSNLEKGGLFVVGGHYGFIDGINVQIDNNGNINKRLRSKRHWVHTLKDVGFSAVKLYRNNAYLKINERLPENNVLIATK